MDGTLVDVVEVAETLNTENLELLLSEIIYQLNNLHTLVATQNEILGHIYASVLFGFALLVPVFVCVLLYNFFKKFM